LVEVTLVLNQGEKMRTFVVIACSLMAGMTDAAERDRMISVYGDSEFVACPNGATVTLAVNSGGPTTKEVFDANNKAINEIFTAVQALGIEKDSIKTSYFSIAPRYRVVNNENVFAGYVATNQVAITVKDLDKVSPVLNAATEAGATNVTGVNFTYGDLTEQTRKAKLEALTEAKNKAAEMLDTLGAKLGKVVALSDNPPRSQFSEMHYARAAMADAPGADSAIAGGDQKFVIQMQVTFEITD
jgi:uncharacterized protein YggE